VRGRPGFDSSWRFLLFFPANILAGDFIKAHSEHLMLRICPRYVLLELYHSYSEPSSGGRGWFDACIRVVVRVDR
jgi:hypothetical protein